jgi:hypothetical protein
MLSKNKRGVIDGAVVMYGTFHTEATPKPHQRETKTKLN